MKLRLFVLLACLIGVAYYFGAKRFGWDRKLEAIVAEQMPPMPELETAPAPVYKWTDAQGRTQYGTEVPKGVRAEPATGGTVTSVKLPKLPSPPKPEQSDPLGGKTIQELATERAINQATR